LFTAPGVRPVAVVTQVAGEGTGLMNAAERYAGAVRKRYCPDQEVPPLWVERQLWPEGSGQDSRLQRVVFAGAGGYGPYGPRWSAVTHEQLEYLVGAAVDTGRGDGYVPRPVEAEPRLVFDEFAVTRLDWPRPFPGAGVHAGRPTTRTTIPSSDSYKYPPDGT
jgi:hypothetical protein